MLSLIHRNCSYCYYFFLHESGRSEKKKILPVIDLMLATSEMTAPSALIKMS